MNFTLWYVLLPAVNGYMVGSIVRKALPGWAGYLLVIFFCLGALLYYLEGKKEIAEEVNFHKLLLNAGIKHEKRYGLIEGYKRSITLVIMSVTLLISLHNYI